MKPKNLINVIKKSHKSKNIDPVDVLNIIYAITDYNFKSPIQKDKINLKIRSYFSNSIIRNYKS